jgi:3-oxoadipate enol-lactonase
MSDGLLLVHAFPLDADMWQEQVASLSGRLPVVAPHLPGFGGTAPAGELMTMSAAAARCVEALDDAGVDRAVVCGLSMGGYVALELWRSAPERFAGLVLANTRAGSDTSEAAAGRRALAERLRSEGSAFLVQSPPPLLSDSAPGELWERVRSLIAAQSADAIAAAALGMAQRPDSTSDLAGIDVPSLVLTSSRDTLIQPDATVPMAEQIPGAELAVIPDVGHLSNLEAPARFDELLDAHLTRCGLPG